MNYGQVIKRADGSYIIQKNGLPYHVPNEGEFTALWADVNTYALANPDKVTMEVVPEPPEPTIQEQIAQAMDYVQHRLDAFARTRQYDDSKSCVGTYLGCSDETYAAEAAYMQEAIVRSWQWANAYCNEILAGTRPMPSLKEFAAALEAAVPLAWPVPNTRVTANL